MKLLKGIIFLGLLTLFCSSAIADEFQSYPTSVIKNSNYTISWDLVGPSRLVNYKVKEYKNNILVRTVSSSGTSVTLSNSNIGSYKYVLNVLRDVYDPKVGESMLRNFSDTIFIEVLSPPNPPYINVPSSPTTKSLLSISWSQVTGATSYNIEQQYNNGSWQFITSKPSIVDPTYATNVTLGGNYSYRIQSCNNIGCGNWRVSSPVSVIVPPLKPSGVVVPTVQVLNEQILVSWNATQTATYYQLLEKVDGGQSVSVLSSYTGISYNRLVSGSGQHTYHFSVRACNSAGCSAYVYSSAVNVLFPPSVPASISVPTATVTNGSIGISWAAASTATS
ncbi:MAG: hypothetical protein V7749_12050, partial [Cocleimonas sp.]